MKKKRITIRDAKRTDDFLMRLAAYESTKGMIVDFLDVEVIKKTQSDMVKIFNYFKMCIQSGEYTLLELEDHVCRRNSAVYQDDIKIENLDDFDNDLDDFDNDLKFEEDIGQSYAGEPFTQVIALPDSFFLDEKFGKKDDVLDHKFGNKDDIEVEYNKENNKDIDVEFGGNIKPFSDFPIENDEFLNESDFLDNSLDDINEIIDNFSKDKNNDKKSFFNFLLDQLINKKKDEDDDKDGITSGK
jgi:hypothetical protein